MHSKKIVCLFVMVFSLTTFAGTDDLFKFQEAEMGNNSCDDVVFDHCTIIGYLKPTKKSLKELFDELRQLRQERENNKSQLLKDFTPEKSKIITQLIREKKLSPEMLGIEEGHKWEVGGGLNAHHELWDIDETNRQ